MIIDDFHIDWTIGSPHEANSPLIVDTNAVLPLSISLQRFKMIAWRYTQVIKDQGPVQLLQLSKRRSFNIDPATYTSALKEGLGVLALEALYRH